MTINSQAVRDVAASHEMLVHLFERIHLFLQRLDRYTGIPLTNDLTGLLGKIMAQLLTILALATKVMRNGRISESDLSLCPISIFHYVVEKVLKKLVGKTEVEDAVLQLDMLTKEESLMIVGRNLQVTHRVDENVEAMKVLAEDSAKANKDGTQLLLSIIILVLTLLCAPNSDRSGQTFVTL